MSLEWITRRDDVAIRRMVLAPGEAMAWHVDPCHRFSVVVRGDALRIEFRDGETVDVPVHAGLTGWDAPEARVHRAVNAGDSVYEEVVTFWLDAPDMDPQPEQA